MSYWPERGHLWPLRLPGKLGKPESVIIQIALGPVRSDPWGWPHWPLKTSGSVSICVNAPRRLLVTKLGEL